MARIYRFELTFLGEPRGVGFLQGLDDVGLSDAEVSSLTSMFNALPVLELEEPVSFWFTEEGIRSFGAAINRVNLELSLRGWRLAGAFMKAPPGENAPFGEEDIMYQDQFQIALPKEAVDEMFCCDILEYVEIFDVETFQMTSENEVVLEFQKEINALPFDPPVSALRDLGKRIEEAWDGQGKMCGTEADALMYQLWQRNPEELERMGYDYSDGEFRD